MLVRLPSLKLVRLWALLLVATIGLQAALPAPPTVQLRSGSAFSAGTFEVALYDQRAERTQRQAVTPLPLTTLATFDHTGPALMPTRHDHPTLRPDSTGPPLRDIHSWDPAPRAPPRA